MERLFLRARNSSALMVAVGFLLRLASVGLLYRYHLNPALDHWRFGWEMGRVGRSVFDGGGFSSPMYQPSGATAWMAPLYPLLIALGFKLFGLYSAASAWFILGLNAFFGAVTVIPVRAAARRIFGVAALAESYFAGWAWALLPYSIYVAGERIWENTLTTLIAATLIWLTYALEEDATWSQWILLGGLWGIAALTSPALLSPLLPMALWIACRHQRTGRRWFWRATVSALVFFAIVSPWVERNYVEFHRLIPVRDIFWLEVHVGNNGDDRQPCPDAVHPSNSAGERSQWDELGEISYMDAKKVESKNWLKSHPQEFALLTIRRAFFVWTGYWSASKEYLEGEPMEPFATAYFTTMTLLGGAGFYLLWRRGMGEVLLPMLFFLLIFPVPYYITHPSYDYRHAMDPILVLLGTYASLKLFGPTGRRNRKRT